VEGFRALLHARESVLHDLERAEKDKLKAFEEKEKYLANPPPEQRRMSLTGFIKQKTLVDYVRPFGVCHFALRRSWSQLIWSPVSCFCRRMCVKRKPISSTDCS
jgi:hypothetical protein